LAGTARLKYAANVRVIRTMCSGRLDPQFIFAALREGADAVLIGGCHPGDCHYQEGNYKTLRRFVLMRQFLASMGIEPERVRLEWIAASEGDKVQRVINEMTHTIRHLGPMRMEKRAPARSDRDTGETAYAGRGGSGGRRPAMSKPKVAFYWCASCGGCEEAVVDLNEAILKVVEAVDIVFWPVALDFKKTDVEAVADGAVAVSFINGAVRSSEQHEMVELLRRKSQLVVAFGSCAHTGGVPGLGNLFSREQLVDTAYRDVPSVENGDGARPAERSSVPEGTLTLPELWRTVKTLDQTITVDYYLPGCPPPVKLIAGAVAAILEGKLPPRGSTLASDIALCDECKRKNSKPEKLTVKQFHRPHEIMIDSELCLLAQGLLCLGPVTRAGCEGACPSVNMPCTGCMGSTSRVQDFGAKALSAVASLLEAKEESDIVAGLSRIVDPAGTFFRYSLPASLLHRRYQPETSEGTTQS
jgi:F420-non-reducing hydrogenase small subunit